MGTINSHRAQEIASSPDMVNVTYNGTPMYIEHVDEQIGTATVHPLEEPNKKQSISLTDLEEH